MSSMHKIDSDVLKFLQSQVTITDIADVVKELLENSVDSNATEVVIKFRTDDFYEVRCEDNGSGMTPDDLAHIGKRSYTSKFDSSTLENLKHVETFGFRGEALHSIINVCSKVDIITRPQGWNANYRFTYDAEGLRQIENTDTGTKVRHTSGTVVTASNIFGPLPVRFNHLQKASNPSMINKLRNIVYGISVANSHVKIKLFKIDSIGNESLVISAGGYINGKNVLAESLRAVYGISVLGSYESLEAEYGDYKVSGVIVLSPINCRAYQSLFLNKRRVLNSNLMKSINNVFAKSGFNDQDEILLPNITKKHLSPRKGKSPTKIVGKSFAKYPVFVFNLRCPQSISDLIQDSTKLVYESKHLEIIEVLIAKLLKRFLKSHGYNVNYNSRKMNTVHSKAASDESLTLKRPAMKLLVNTRSKNFRGTTFHSKEENSEDQYLARKLDFGVIKFPERVSANEKRSSCNHQIGSIDQLERKSLFFPGISKINFSKDSFEDISVIGQVDKKFILVRVGQQSNKSVLLVIDQHACDERIRVEALLKEFIENTIFQKNSENLTMMMRNFKFKVSQDELEMLLTFYQSFAILGIEFNLSQDSVEVTRLPSILASKIEDDTAFIKNFLLEHCHDLQSKVKFQIQPNMECDWWTLIRFLPRIIIDLINSRACRSSIMFGDELTADQCQEYVTKLQNCKLPFQCAHGRPSIVPLVDLNSIE